MRIFIGYQSAWEFWRSEHAPVRTEPTRALPTPKDALDRCAIESARLDDLGITKRPAHFVVAESSARAQCSSAVCHVATTLPPAGSFARVRGNVFVSSPNLLFIQMAHVVSFAELLLLGFELCGTYVPDETDPRGFRDREQPLTSASSLRRFIEKAKGLRGIKESRKAVRFIADNSASPMESIQAVLLCLPCHLGGFGVEQGELNGIVDCALSGKPFPNGKFYRCDILWRSHGLVVEYESDLCHSGPNQISKDSKRRTDLTAAGYTVATVTSKQVFGARELEKVANLLIRRMGKKVRRPSYNVLTRRYELRRALFATIPKAEPQKPRYPDEHGEAEGRA